MYCPPLYTGRVGWGSAKHSASPPKVAVAENLKKLYGFEVAQSTLHYPP